jgi:hypothetical protein
VIQNIKKLGAELHFQSVADGKVAMNRKIPLPSTKTSQRIAPKVSLGL